MFRVRLSISNHTFVDASLSTTPFANMRCRGTNNDIFIFGAITPSSKCSTLVLEMIFYNLVFSYSVLVFVVTVNTPAQSLGGHLSSEMGQAIQKNSLPSTLFIERVPLSHRAENQTLNRRPKLSRLSGITRACDCTFVATRSLASPPSIRTRIVAALKSPDRQFLRISWSVPGQWSAFTPWTVRQYDTETF